MPSSVNSSHEGLATLVNGRPPSPTMSATTTLSPPSPVMGGGGGGGGKHQHHPSIISPDAMADVKSKIEKLASELKQQQQQKQQQRCRQQSSNNKNNNNTRPILPHSNTDSIITTTSKTTATLTRPVLSPFSRAKSHQLQQQQQHIRHPSTPGPGPVIPIPGLEPASRSLSDLHNECSYLLHNLQTQGERATRLYQRYAHLEAKKEALASASASATASATTSASPSDENNTTASVSSKKKKIKKDISLLRSRIAESTQQEQLIMLRLGEIHVELVNRGRWVMTHQHQQQRQGQQQIIYFPMSAVVEGQGYFGHHQWHQQQNHGGVIPATPSSADSYSNSPVGGDYLYTPSVLSPLSPSFVPSGGVSFFEDIWTRPSHQGQDESTSPEDTHDHHLAPAPAPEQEHEHHRAVEGEEEEEQDDQTPKPKLPSSKDSSKDHDLEAVPLSAVTPKFSTTTSTVSTSTLPSLPSEHLATPILPSRIPWDEYPSDSEDDESFESFDGSSFTPIGVTTINPLACTNPSINSSGSAGSGSGVMVSEPEEEQGEEEEEEEAEGSDDSASEPGDLLSEQQRRTASFSRGGEGEEGVDGWIKGNRRLSMPSLKNLWPAALAAVGVQGLGEEGEEEEVPEMRLDTVI